MTHRLPPPLPALALLVASLLPIAVCAQPVPHAVAAPGPTPDPVVVDRAPILEQLRSVVSDLTTLQTQIEEDKLRTVPDVQRARQRVVDVGRLVALVQRKLAAAPRAPHADVAAAEAQGTVVTTSVAVSPSAPSAPSAPVAPSPAPAPRVVVLSPTLPPEAAAAPGPPPRGAAPISEYALAALVDALRATSASGDEQLRLIEESARANAFLVAQAQRVLPLVRSGGDRLIGLELLVPRLLDRENAGRLVRLYSSSEDRERARGIVGE